MPRGDFRNFHRAEFLELLGVVAALLAERVQIFRLDPEPTPASVIDSTRSGAFRPLCSDE